MQHQIAKQIILQPVEALIPYARNSRTHSDEQVAQIAASIREFGFTNPVLVDDEGGIVAGHGRVMAARQIGMTAVPTINVGWLSERQRRAYVIADNQLAMNAGWDSMALSAELSDLQDIGFDMGLLGFDAEALAGLLGSTREAELPALKNGDRQPFQQMTFTVHDDQKAQIDAALAAAKRLGPFDSENENSNGNALARICETFISDHA
jgi:ParB-like chromosome segregation protein Spo0J